MFAALYVPGYFTASLAAPGPLGPVAPAAPTRGGSDRPRRAAITKGQNKSTRHKRNSENQDIPRRTANHHRDVCSLPTRRRCTRLVSSFFMHSQPNSECACRCLETEALQLSSKKANLCRGARQVNTLTRLIAMAPIDDATKFLSHEQLWAPAAPAQRTKVGRAPAAPG